VSIQVRTLSRDEIIERLDDIAKLRITVFREWPYLYDGDAKYEREYLRPYSDSPRAIVVGAFDEAALVGASTGTPLLDHQEGVAEAVHALGLPQADVFYFAESVLLPAFQGRGIGHAFFDHRERHAQRHVYRYVAFASVIRPKDHPARPSSARDLTTFWRKRGYAPADGATASLSWRDVGEPEETEKQLTIWMRDLADKAA
jgi:GNAT superfamily N-acetyltransferase